MFFTIIFGIIGMIFNFIIFIVSYMFVGLCGLYRYINLRWFSAENQQADLITYEPLVEVQEETQVLDQPFETDTVLNSIKPFVSSKNTQIIPLQDIGNLTINQLAGTTTVQRSLTLTNKDLIAEFNVSKFKLADVEVKSNVSSQSLIEISIRDVEELLNSKWTDRHAEVNEIAATYQSKIATSSMQQSQESISPVVAALPEKAIKVAMPKKFISKAKANDSNAEKSYVYGKFVDSAKVLKPGKDFKQVYVQIKDDALDGGLTKVWGNDLANALETANVKVGDYICIISHGYQIVNLPENKTSKMQKYEICHVKEA